MKYPIIFSLRAAEQSITQGPEYDTILVRTSRGEAERLHQELSELLYRTVAPEPKKNKEASK